MKRCFRALVTLTLDWVILHTVMHHTSTSTYIPNFTEIEETFCGRTDVRTRPTLLGRLKGVDLKTTKAETHLEAAHFARDQSKGRYTGETRCCPNGT